MWLLLLVTFVSASHLFQGPSGLSWDEDDLLRIRDLHKRSFDDPENFNGTLSSYLGLSHLRGLTLPIPINIILLGFDGHGKDGINIEAEELQSWFEAMDRSIPHTRVPLTELTCKEDGYCLDFERVKKPSPLHSYVHYNLTVRVVAVSSEVTKEFEQVLKTLMRPGENGRRHVDVTGLEPVIDGMLATMGVLWGYNILLINPNIEEKYSYRAGFSKSEIDALTDDATKLKELTDTARKFRNRLPLPPGHDVVDRAKYRMRPVDDSGQFLFYESGMWTRQIRSWLSQRKRLLMALPKGMAFKEAVLMNGIHGDATVLELLDDMKQNAVHRSDLKGVGGFRVMEPEEGCPLDMWVGHRRWMLIDLAAMPMDWGPFVGGDGVKTINTLPSVASYFSTMPPKREDQGSTELKEKLRSQRDKHLEELHGYRVEGYVPKDVLRAAEDDLFSRFHAEHCLHMQHPPPLCQRIEEVRMKLANKEDVFMSEGGDDLFIAWLGMDEDVDEGELEHASRMKDLFLAHTASVVSKAIRHIYIPPTLTWTDPHEEEEADRSTPFARKVTFRTYLLTDPIRNPKNRMIPFDTEAFKRELMGLKLGNQEFKFTVRHMNILDDPLLSTALATSLRSSSVEQMETPSDVFAEERLYFDAAELETLLKKRLFAEDGPQRKSRSKTESHLEVPIFVLMLDRDRPIFIDRHYIARASEHMVIVVQNGQHRGQHPLGIICAGATAGQTLAAPLKAAVAAVLQHLGGLLPPHLGYSPDHMAVAHDWAWSIGANPFSLTSPGWKISEAQKDALHRTYLLDAIDLSVYHVNQGISYLRSIRNMSGTFQYVQSQAPELVQLLKDYSTLVELWRRVLNDAMRLDFTKATIRLQMVEETAEAFVKGAAFIAKRTHPAGCRETHLPFSGIAWLTQEVMGGALLLTVCFLIYKILPKKRKLRSD